MWSARRASLPLLILFLSLFSSAIASAASTTQPVKVECTPVVIERVTFDAAHPPDDMPPLKSGEIAQAVFNFRIHTVHSYALHNRRKSGGTWSADVKLARVSLQLELKIKIYTPADVSERIRAHEDGHREISERIYAQAAAIAQEAGQRHLGQTFELTGIASKGALEDAAKETLGAAAKEDETWYLSKTADRSGRINDIYDELTHHGTNRKLSVPDAIDQAFAKDDADQKGNDQPE